MTDLSLIRHLVARPGEALPPLTGLYDYVLGAGGLYLRAERPGLRVCQALAETQVRGLAGVEPELAFTWPRVPADLTARMLAQARAERDAVGRPIEVMYHLSWAGDRWELVKPLQRQTLTAVYPVGPFAGTSYETYLIEAHSHHDLTMHTFSSTDDASEGATFRLFALLADIFTAPMLLLRLNVFGYHWNVPAALAFELPEGLADGSAEAADPDLLAGTDALLTMEALGWL